MSMDVIPVIYRHLEALPTPPDETKIDLLLSSNGGDGVVPWRLVTLIREFCAEFSILVPHRAFSAATLACLGADEVIMHPMGMLGPTDPTVANDFNPPNPTNPTMRLGISVEDVASYIALVKDDVGIRHEDELVKALLQLASQVHPLALGNVKRHTLQSQMMGTKLLKLRNGSHHQLAPHDIDEIIRKLTSELFFHGHPINRREARDDIGLKFVVDATPAVAEKMWDLYSLYATENKLNEAFMPLQEAFAKVPLPIPPTGAQPNAATVQLEPVVSVSVESAARSDRFVCDYEVHLKRDSNGAYVGQPGLVRQAWQKEGIDSPQTDAEMPAPTENENG
jgi:hypothetical protein